MGNSAAISHKTTGSVFVSNESQSVVSTNLSNGRREKLYSIDDYYKMAEVGILKPDDKTELINGKVIFMSPVGSRHAGITDYLYSVCLKQLDGSTIVRGQNPIKLDDGTEPEPDISLLKKRDDFYVKSLPEPSEILLLIEVADSTLKTDLTDKLKLYASAGVPEYWVVDLVNNQLICFTEPKGDQYLKEVSTKKAFNSPTVKGLTVDLSRFWELDEKKD